MREVTGFRDVVTLEIKLILCPVDFSEFSIRAYHYALSLAEHYRAQLVAQHIVELSRYPHAEYVGTQGDYQEFSRALREGGEERLQEFMRKYTHDEVQPELAVHEGVAADSILSFAQERKMDLIVMGTHGRRGFDRLVLGSVTDRVMRTAPCPVLAISKLPRDSSAPGEERPRVYHLSRILFCAAFSEASERALNYAISATAEYDAELTLLHVLEEVPGPAKTEEAIAIAIAIAIATATATRQLDKLIPQKERKTFKIRPAVRMGKPYMQIIQFVVEAQIDMVTMGVSGRGALDRAVFGSTSYRVMRLGPCPVLAVHV
jgi:nucleotide-binding universal stress UspA family protein